MNLKQMFLATLVGTVVLTGCSNDAPETTPEVTTPEVTTPETTDAVTYPTQSVVTDGASLAEAGQGEQGWISLFQADVTTEEEIVIGGPIFKKDKESGEFVESGRKVALYDQDADKNKTASYTLTAPKVTLTTKTQLRGGTLVGDLYVDAMDCSIKDMTIEGNIFFASQEIMDSFVNDAEMPATVTGTQTLVEGVDAMTYPTQSVVTDGASLVEAGQGEQGWISLFQADVTTDEEIVISGPIFKKDKESGEFVESGRKVALYDQDADKNKTASYTLTAPKVTLETKTQLRGGTLVGDLYVNAMDCSIKDMTIEGNIYFASQEIMDSFVNDAELPATVSGTQELVK